MSLYEGIKDVISIAQKADNIDLVKQLLDLGSQALEMQATIEKLKEENAELRKKADYSKRIIRHTVPVITLNDDPNNLYYCAHCWDSENLLIQVAVDKTDSGYRCHHCNAHGFIDSAKRRPLVYYK